MERSELSADSERCGCVVAADRLVTGGYQVVQALAVRLLEKGDRLDRIVDRWLRGHGRILTEMTISERLDSAENCNDNGHSH